MFLAAAAAADSGGHRTVKHVGFYLTEPHSGAARNGAERPRVIGCIRVVKKLMPLEILSVREGADSSMCITQPHKSGSPRLACLHWFGFNYLSYPALTTSTSLMGLPRSGITHALPGQLAGWPGGAGGEPEPVPSHTCSV